ncbi:MAG: hypothetical protein ABII12_05400 [Planctomycetota bacterium]
MRRERRLLTSWILIALMLCSTGSVGCDPTGWFGSNMSVNVIVPVGLGGSPGLLNPFGVVQAWVNSLIGTADSSDDGDGGAAGSSNPAQSIDPAIPVILN